jgi:phosphoglycerate-specific signal transduction histidine kinase
MLTERREKLTWLGVLATEVAHEIRNPVTAIKARLFTLNKAIEAVPNAVADANVIERDRNAGGSFFVLESNLRTFTRARPTS